MNKRSHYYSYFFISLMLVGILGFSLKPFSAGAQLLDNAYTASDVSVELLPEVPQPNQNLTITLSSFSVDLDKARMTWYQDDKMKNTGTGIKSFSIMVGDVGTTTTISVSIVINGSNRFDKKIVVSPTEVDLLWEALDSYVPPFYEGKALPSSEATIKVVAIPNIKSSGGSQLKASDFVYNWKRNYVADQGVSGFSKNSLVFRASYLNKEENVSVNISSVVGNTGGSGRLLLTTGKPQIMFYEDSPTEGTLLRTALNSGYRLTNEEATVVAVPYFFSVPNPTTTDLSYKWSINNNSVDTPNPKNTLVIRGGGETGRAKVGLSIESVSKLFQLTNQSFFVDIIK